MHSFLHHVADFSEALAISKEITAGDVILVKGSRAEGLERLSDELKDFLRSQHLTSEGER